MSDQPRLADFLALRYSAGGHPVTRLVSQRAGAVLAFAGLRLGVSPSAITLLGLAASGAGAFMFAVLPAGWEAALACAAVLQLAYALDCADGQLARATGRTSALGAWLDLACDHVRNIMVAGAVLAWLARSGIDLAAALLACGVMLAGTVVQTHTVTTLRLGDARDPPGHRGPAWARTTAVALLDTASVLLCLALLRPAPGALLAYAALAGGGYALMTLTVVRAHLGAGRAQARD